MSSKPVMKCGHTANAIDENGKPCCVICAGIKDGYDVIDENQPNLEGRKSRCTYYGKTFMYRGKIVHCESEVPSRTTLPFFEHKPDKEFDEHYCGCWGWD